MGTCIGALRPCILTLPPMFLVVVVATAAHAEYYAQIVREKATLRGLIEASTDILRDAYDPTMEPRQLLSRAEERVFGILETKGHGQVTTIRDVLTESIARIDARMKNEHAFGGIETDPRPGRFRAPDTGPGRAQSLLRATRR